MGWSGCQASDFPIYPTMYHCHVPAHRHMIAERRAEAVGANPAGTAGGDGILRSPMKKRHCDMLARDPGDSGHRLYQPAEGQWKHEKRWLRVGEYVPFVGSRGGLVPATTVIG